MGKAAADAFNRASPKFSTFDLAITSVVGRGDLAVATGNYKASSPAGKDSAGKGLGNQPSRAVVGYVESSMKVWEPGVVRLPLTWKEHDLVR